MSPEYVRNNYSIKMELNSTSEIRRLLEVIQPKKLKKLDKTSFDTGVDIRLVIDLTNDAGKRTSYFASRNFLFTEDLRYARKINKAFREKFRF